MCLYIIFFFFNDTATTEIYTLSLHDALPILPWDFSMQLLCSFGCARQPKRQPAKRPCPCILQGIDLVGGRRSEEHTSELQSHSDLVCRLLLEKKKKKEKVYMPCTKACYSRII